MLTMQRLKNIGYPQLNGITAETASPHSFNPVWLDQKTDPPVKTP